jgi:tellurite resistance protein TerC
VIAAEVTSVLAPWAWPVLLGAIGSALLVDILIVHRRPHVASLREAATESAIWITLGVSFVGIIWLAYPRADSGALSVQYLAAYLIEKSLSVDNVFVWASIFAHFGVPREYQHRTLFWGIFGALVLRFMFILVGTTVIERFEIVMLLFGAFLIFTGSKIVRGKDADHDPGDSVTLRVFRRLVPSTTAYDGQKLWTRVNGRRLATPLLAVLVVVEMSDVVFAVDSVPAVLAVSREQFVVFASNAWAILGLRALYFLLADMRSRFVYMPHTIALLLVYVGGKMIAAYFGLHIPVLLSLAVIVSFLVGGVLLSLAVSRRRGYSTVPRP